jgi:hypothetical protein
MSPSQEPSADVLNFPGRARLPNSLGRLAKRLALRYEGFEWAYDAPSRGTALDHGSAAVRRNNAIDAIHLARCETVQSRRSLALPPDELPTRLGRGRAHLSPPLQIS